jgi:hypothetical protein
MRLLVSRPTGALIAATLAACGGTTDPPRATGDAPVRFTVTNALIAPVTLRVDGAPMIILVGGSSSSVGVPRSAQRLTWVSAKPTDAAGRQIPDDIGEIAAPIPGGGTLEIINVIGGQPHVTAGIVNGSGRVAEIGVFDGVKVACAGTLPAVGLDGGRGFVRTGYYRLNAATELRAYRAGSGCTGPYVAWPRGALAAYTPKTGALSLSLDTAP